MDENIVKTLKLENGHTLKIFDTSRRISSDAYLVKMKASVDIDIYPELFTEPLPDDLTCDLIQAELGREVTYEYEVERNFILEHEKDALFDSLVKTFLDNLGQYVAKPVFPEKFVIKLYQDRVN